MADHSNASHKSFRSRWTQANIISGCLFIPCLWSVSQCLALVSQLLTSQLSIPKALALVFLTGITVLLGLSIGFLQGQVLDVELENQKIKRRWSYATAKGFLIWVCVDLVLAIWIFSKSEANYIFIAGSNGAEVLSSFCESLNLSSSLWPILLLYALIPGITVGVMQSLCLKKKVDAAWRWPISQTLGSLIAVGLPLFLLSQMLNLTWNFAVAADSEGDVVFSILALWTVIGRYIASPIIVILFALCGYTATAFTGWQLCNILKVRDSHRVKKHKMTRIM